MTSRLPELSFFDWQISHAYFCFVSAFCFTCKHAETKLKQNNFTETIKHCFAFVLFQFCFSFISVITTALGYGLYRVYIVRWIAYGYRCFPDWIGTLSFCVSLTFAPLSVSFIRSIRSSHGYRACGLLGTAVLTVSCIGSSFVQQPEWLFLTHSLLYGVGSSLLYMASSLVIGDHFRNDHKYHVLATSILLCGYPLGQTAYIHQNRYDHQHQW